MFDISVIGDKKLQKKLDKLDKKLQKKAIREAMKDAMEPVKALAKQRAPQDKGLLVRSIRIGMKTSRKGISAMVRTGTRKQLKIPADSKYYYPAALEYGSRYIKQQSFLRSSLGSKKETVLSKFSRNLRGILER